MIMTGSPLDILVFYIRSSVESLTVIALNAVDPTPWPSDPEPSFHSLLIGSS